MSDQEIEDMLKDERRGRRRNRYWQLYRCANKDLRIGPLEEFLDVSFARIFTEWLFRKVSPPYPLNYH